MKAWTVRTEQSILMSGFAKDAGCVQGWLCRSPLVPHVEGFDFAAPAVMLGEMLAGCGGWGNPTGGNAGQLWGSGNAGRCQLHVSRRSHQSKPEQTGHRPVDCVACVLIVPA